MNNPISYIDISHNPELSRIAAEVELTRKPRELKRDNKTIAIIVPVEVTKKQTQGNYEGILKTFGSWKDVDVAKLKEDLYSSHIAISMKYLI